MQTAYTIILAPNPSIMTGPGTNTIVLGGGGGGNEGAIVIDPAVDDAAYLDTLVQEGEKRGGIGRILITHGHPDHIGGAQALRARLHVPIYAFSRQGVPVERILFAGDMISGLTTNVIAPPDGNMFDYMNSLQRLQEIDIAEIVPAHGPTIANAQAKIAEYIAHRQLREQQILQTLETLPRGVTIPEMVPAIYTDVDPKLHPIAAWSVEAHLLKLEKEGLVERIGEKGWTLVEPTA